MKLTANGPRWTGQTKFVHEHLMDPLKWREPCRIFTDSMSDLFFVEEDWVIDSVVAVMLISCLHESRGGHIFQTLTKRPDRMRAYFSDTKAQERVARRVGTLMEDGDDWYDMIAYRPEGLLHPNMWWGVSVENQAAADERIPELLMTPAAVRFISIEPMIGPVDLLQWLDPTGACCGSFESCAVGGTQLCPARAAWRHTEADGEDAGIDWVIVGCESGPRARDCDPEWIRTVVEQCTTYSVPVFLKQAVGWEHGRETVVGHGIGFGPGSFAKGYGFGGPVIERPYLDTKQYLEFPVLGGVE